MKKKGSKCVVSYFITNISGHGSRIRWITNSRLYLYHFEIKILIPLCILLMEKYLLMWNVENEKNIS